MIATREAAWLREEGYRWLALYLCLWLAAAYLWLAFFYPLMCAPYQSHDNAPLPQINAFEHTITPFTIVMSVPVAWPQLLTRTPASNVSWLLDTHDDAMGPVVPFINILKLPEGAWLKPFQPLRMIYRMQHKSYQHLQISPPKTPPRLAAF